MTPPPNDKTTSHFASIIRDLEMLYQYHQHDTEILIEFLVTDYGFERYELESKSTIDIWSEIEVLQSEYGLSFDYVPAGTFDDQSTGYFRYQFSYGGPTEELRFFVDPEHNLFKAEFWLLDWFEGASIDCTSNTTIRTLWNHLIDIEATAYAFKEAMTT